MNQIAQRSNDLKSSSRSGYIAVTIGAYKAVHPLLCVAHQGRRMGYFVTKASKIVLALAVLACLALLPSILVFWPWQTKLQSLPSPDGNHTAELFRADGIDRNYSVRVDGTRVYHSPDFAPRRDLAYLEALTWDKTGRIVVLEIARHRIFGYDATNHQRLSDDALLATQLPPDVPLSEYYFESEWPGIGRARKPEAPHEVKR
jgi:hypothetical protein